MAEEKRENVILAKWLAGELSREELEKIHREEDVSLLNKIVEAAAELELDEFDERGAWIALKRKKRTSSRRRLLPRPGTAIAAGFAVLLALSLWFWWKSQPRQLVAKVTERPTHILPDGSTARLNAGSRLTFVPWNWDRTVEMEGESFFSVKPGKRFVVKTTWGNVTVLGTSFNVLARPPAYFAVDCYSGRVRVAAGDEELELTPGQRVRLDSVGQLRGEEFSLLDEQTAPWTVGVASFKEQPLPRVFAEMERQFGRPIRHQGLENRIYTGVFPHDDLNKALQLVCGPMGLQFSSNDRGEIVVTK